MSIMSPAESPQGLFPSKESYGVTRINKRVLGIALVVFSGAAVILLATLNGRGTIQAIENKSASEKRKADIAAAPDFQPAKPRAFETVHAAEPAAARPAASMFSSSAPAFPADPNVAKESAEYSKEIRRYYHKVEMQRLSRLDAAMASGMETRGAASSPAQSSQALEAESNAAVIGRLPNGELAMSNARAFEPGPDGTQRDPNLQGRKAAFYNDETTSSYLPTRKEAARSPYEVKEGSVIPGIMISGINSDLPGQIIAQVSQNVFDSVTGEYLLIPQGTKMVGSYDSFVAVGQERAMVAWRRLIFPDGKSIELLNMPGTDQGGYAGFSDEVNNHYFRIFGGAIMMSFLGAGFQLSQPHPRGEYPSNQEIIAAEVGRNISQVGIELSRRDMRIQPTIEIRPGYRFNIMVRRDMILEPYVEAGR